MALDKKSLISEPAALRENYRAGNRPGRFRPARCEDGGFLLPRLAAARCSWREQRGNSSGSITWEWQSEILRVGLLPGRSSARSVCGSAFARNSAEIRRFSKGLEPFCAHGIATARIGDESFVLLAGVSGQGNKLKVRGWAAVDR